jgi:hypothetical protein
LQQHFKFATLSSSTRNSMLFYVRNIIEIKYRKKEVLHKDPHVRVRELHITFKSRINHVHLTVWPSLHTVLALWAYEHKSLIHRCYCFYVAYSKQQHSIIIMIAGTKKKDFRFHCANFALFIWSEYGSILKVLAGGLFCSYF